MKKKHARFTINIDFGRFDGCGDNVSTCVNFGFVTQLCRAILQVKRSLHVFSVVFAHSI